MAQERPSSPAPATPQAKPAGNIQVKSGLSYEIKGTGSQFVELILKPGQMVTGEITALLYYDHGVAMKMRSSGSINAGEEKLGIFGKIMGLGKAVLTGQKLFMMSFANTTQRELKVAFSMPYQGSVIPIDLAALGNKFYCQSNSFLCATNDVKISSASSKDLGSGFFSSGLSMEKIEGAGVVFLFCGGSLIQKSLAAGEVMNVSNGATLAMQQSITFKNKFIRNVGVTGQGHALNEIIGPGKVLLQSLAFQRTSDTISSSIAQKFSLKIKKAGFGVAGMFEKK